jgi:CRISPR-associated protein Cmr2
MSYEWHVNFPLQYRDRRDPENLDAVVEGQGRFQPVRDLYARLKLLAQSLEDQQWNTKAKSRIVREERPGAGGKVEIPRTYLRLAMTYHDRPSESWYTAEHIKPQLDKYSPLSFATPKLTEDNLSYLPENSFFLYIPFTLAAPYLSKDDTSFYVHENPVRKDPVLRVPVVGSTSWKGSFRAALRWILKTEDADPRVIRLLGNSKGEEKNFKRGRLSFYPTFFDALEVQVINPHRRETGAGDKPIHIEGVPRNAKGDFALLYTPIIPSKPDGPLPDWNEVLEDLNHVGQAAYTLLGETGFGAKTASGMGRATEEISGAYLLMHRWIEVSPELPSPPSDKPPPEQFQPDSKKFLDEKGRLLLYDNDKLEDHIAGQKARSEYKRQRKACEKWREQRGEWEAWKQEIALLEGRSERRMIQSKLNRLDDLKDLRRQVEKQVKERNDE